jgi:lysophospholipase L1-like esterase
LDAVARLIELARSSGAAVVVALHPTQNEIRNGLQPGHDRIATVAREANALIIELLATKADLETVADWYRDDIHPSSKGQEVIAGALSAKLAAASPQEQPE